MPHSKNHIFRLRTFLNNLKSEIGCNQCGINNPIVLDFHHRDSKNKKFGLDYYHASKYCIQKILQEILKCKILCANCHRLHHSKNL